MAPSLLSLTPKHTFNHTPAKLQAEPVQGQLHVGAAGLVHCLPHAHTKHKPFAQSGWHQQVPLPSRNDGDQTASQAPHPQTSHEAQELAQGGSSDGASKLL